MHRGGNGCLLLRPDLKGKRHKRRGVIVLKQRGPRFFKDRGRERAPVFAKFDRVVHSVAIADIARISKYGTVAEGPWPKFLPTLVPSNELVPYKEISCRLSGVIQALIAKLV